MKKGRLFHGRSRKREDKSLALFFHILCLLYWHHFACRPLRHLCVIQEVSYDTSKLNPKASCAQAVWSLHSAAAYSDSLAHIASIIVQSSFWISHCLRSFGYLYWIKWQHLQEQRNNIHLLDFKNNSFLNIFCCYKSKLVLKSSILREF